MKTGRPTKYTPELADKICQQLANGISLRTVCKSDEMPSTVTVFAWMRTNEEFLNQYARAKQESADAMAEEVLYIADTQETGTTTTIKGDGSVETKEEDMLGHRRLQIDTRKWLMAKMKPKKYGDKLDVTTGGESINPYAGLTVEELRKLANDNS